MFTPARSDRTPIAREPSAALPAVSNSFQTYTLAQGLCLDARRALWYAPARTLVVADLHLGYAWAQRKAGLLLPLSPGDDTVDRLEALLDCYRPDQLVLLGDIVHRALDLPALKNELCRLTQTVSGACQLRVVAGNHDRHLPQLIRKLGLTIAPLEPWVTMGPHCLMHGDDFTPERKTDHVQPDDARGFTIIGHEHPALRLGDGVTGSAKCPCFLVGQKLLILPAFSSWAAGSAFRPGNFMSNRARSETFVKAVAILNGKLLPIPLGL